MYVGTWSAFFPLGISRLDDQAKALPVNIQNLHAIIPLQIFPELGNVNIHTPGGEVIIIPPYFGQGKLPGHKVVFMQGEQSK